MSLTINHPLRLQQMEAQDYVIDGTPADCINIALQKVMPQWPDFVVSGINAGENLCEDVFFSGTVAAAYTAHLYGIPALAVSMIADPHNGEYPFVHGADITATLLRRLIPLNNTNIVYNLNIPACNNGEVALTTTGLKQYKPSVVERTDPRNRKYYWLGTGTPELKAQPGSDLEATSQGKISLSVLKYNLNTPEELKKLHEAFNDQPNQ